MGIPKEYERDTMMKAIGYVIEALYPKQVSGEQGAAEPNIALLGHANEADRVQTAFPVYPTQAAGHDILEVGRMFLIAFLTNHRTTDTILWRFRTELIEEELYASRRAIYLMQCRTCVRPEETVVEHENRP